MVTILATLAAFAGDGLTVGEAVPDFALTDLEGNAVKLSDYKGKTVVLEWFNPGCPYVKYAYEDGPLKSQAAKNTGEEVVWLAVNSSAPGKQGHGVETNKTAASQWSITNPILPDETGSTGRAFGAKTTPHMYVIDTEGKLAYQGALDNQPMGRNPDQANVNYIDRALANISAGQPVEIAETQPYGCSVKYNN